MFQNMNKDNKDKTQKWILFALVDKKSEKEVMKCVNISAKFTLFLWVCFLGLLTSAFVFYNINDDSLFLCKLSRKKKFCVLRQ